MNEMRLCLSDVNECVSLPGVCGSARCENVEGSFMCECDQAGHSYDTAARRCVHAAALGKHIRDYGCCVAAAAHASHKPTPSQPHALNKIFISVVADVVAVGASSNAADGITILGLSFPQLPTKAAIPLITT